MKKLLVITACLGAQLLLGQTQNFDNVEEKILPVQGNVYMLVGAGGNTQIDAKRGNSIIAFTLN